MKTTRRFSPLLMVAVATLALAACDDSSKTAEETAAPEATEAVAEVAPVASVTVADATAFATAEGSTTGAVFFKITNSGMESDRLVGATTTAAQAVEIHATETDASGVAQMRKIDAVEILAGQTVELAASDVHLMLVGLTQPLTAGSKFDVTLDLEKGADVVVPVTVASPVAAAAEEAADAAKEAADTAVEAAGEAVDAAGEAADAAGEAVKDAAETAVEETKEVIEEVAPAPSEVPASDAKAAE